MENIWESDVVHLIICIGTLAVLNQRNQCMSNDKVLALDIEVASEVPSDGSDWKENLPLGISCIAALMSDWKRFDGCVTWFNNVDSIPISGGIDEEHLKIVINALLDLQEEYTIVTWNGLGFDFHVLAEESGLWDKCKKLALNHIDIMFQFFCEQGFPISLKATAQGLGLHGKTEGMEGALAPILWKPSREKLPLIYQYMSPTMLRWKVLEYVCQDVATTLEVYQRIVAHNYKIRWKTKAGKFSVRFFSDTRLKTVKECLDLPEPDTSWMDSPIPRSSFTDWLNE